MMKKRSRLEIGMETNRRRKFVSYSHVKTRGDQIWVRASHKPANGLDTDGTDESEHLRIVRENLPSDVEINTSFGKKKVCYADYTASGRPLTCIEEYLSKVVGPLFANTHTENSTTGLQTTHFREEARDIVLEGVGGNRNDHILLFVGSGVTGAIDKFIRLMDIAVPHALKPLLASNVPLEKRPLILISDSEHHSNELMWRENYCDVSVISRDESGVVDMFELTRVLENARKLDETRIIIGSFTAGSNVTGLRNDPHVISKVLHAFGAIAVFDFAGAAAYVDVNMQSEDLDSHLDAIFLSPHKFVGGPGCPGILVARKSCFREEIPPTIAGGGTVQMVWKDGVLYEDSIIAREEAGTPQILGAIKCGLVFQLRNLIGPKRIEALEGSFAKRAVERLQAAGVWVMGDDKTNIHSPHRLSITSFNVFSPVDNKLLHPHFVATLLNDLYGIQSRSGCSCAGPLGMSLFKSRMPEDFVEKIIELTNEGFHAFKPGWTRVNFNYFIEEEEFDFILTAIEQISQHGWKLLPLYALCLRTGGFVFNSIVPFDKFDGVRLLREFQFSQDNAGMEWIEPMTSDLSFTDILDQATIVYQNSLASTRKLLHRFRDYRDIDTTISPEMEKYRYFALGSDVLPLVISQEEIEHSNSNPFQKSLATQEHPVANPMYTFGRSRG